MEELPVGSRPESELCTIGLKLEMSKSRGEKLAGGKAFEFVSQRKGGVGCLSPKHEPTSMRTTLSGSSLKDAGAKSLLHSEASKACLKAELEVATKLVDWLPEPANKQ